MWTKLIFVLILSLLMILTIASAVQAKNLARDDVAEPEFTVLGAFDGYVIRHYEPYIIASVVVSGGESSAMNRGFRPIADYIFGNNAVREDGKAEESQKIAMTAPVISQPVSSEKIAMTTPVLSREVESGKYRVSFIMPREYTMATLPEPRNPEVELRSVESQTLAVIEFSGLSGNWKMQKKELHLREALQRDGIEIIGEPTYARYDPPWTLPHLRRNEVMIPVRYEVK